MTTPADRTSLPAAPPADIRQYGRMPADQGTSGFAVAALVLGVLGGVPLAVIFGCVALARIGRTGQRGRGLAIGGLMAAGGWVLVFALVAVAGLAGGSGTGVAATAPTGTPSGTVRFSALQVGDCFTYPAGHPILTVQTLPCTQAHNAEVVGLFDATGMDWPGLDAIEQEANQRCGEMTRTGVDRTALGADMQLSYLYPKDSAAWAAGDHEVVCLVTKPSGTATGSVRTRPSTGG